jgi:hypothetical protein
MPLTRRPRSGVHGVHGNHGVRDVQAVRGVHDDFQTGRPRRPAAAMVGLAVAVAIGFGSRGVAAERQVLLTAACDSYGDLKKQLGWLGPQIDNPGLAGMLESVLLLATQGRGLAGLDVKRPLGIVVSSDGADVAIHGFVPVKDLDKLLTSLQGVTGPVETDGATRRVTLPSGIPLEITERAGWAVIAPAGMAAAPADPAPLLEAVTKDCSLGLEAFPGRMPEAVREQFAAAVAQGMAAAAPDQPPDPDAVRVAIEGLRQTESLSLGVAIDPETDSVFVENRSVMMPGSAAAAALAAAGGGAATVGLPAASDGKQPAIRGHLVQAVSEAAGKRTIESLEQALPPDGGDRLTETISRVLRDIIAAMVASGGVDAAFAVDTAAASDDSPLPAVTAGVRVKDGAALERQLKKLLAADGSKPKAVDVRFDTGRVGDASLHTVAIDIADLPAAERFGKRIDLTLATAPGYAFVLAGGDPKTRVAAALEASGRANPAAKPIAGMEVAMDRVLAYAAARDAAPELAAAAERAAGAESSRLLVSVQPIDRGVATRLSADAGALKAMATLGGGAAGPAGPAGVPLPPLQRIPNGFPVPVPTP